MLYATAACGQDRRRFAKDRTVCRHNPGQSEIFESGRRRRDLACGNGRGAKKEAGLDTDIGQGGRALSGGQRQRISIARALVKHPEILILDDSSSALDYATDAHLRHALQHLPGNPTVILISQRVASIRHADQILVLDNGNAVGLGTHAQLLENCPVYAEICQSQEKNAQRVGEEKVK